MQQMEPCDFLASFFQRDISKPTFMEFGKHDFRNVIVKEGLYVIVHHFDTLINTFNNVFAVVSMAIDVGSNDCRVKPKL